MSKIKIKEINLCQTRKIFSQITSLKAMINQKNKNKSNIQIFMTLAKPAKKKTKIRLSGIKAIAIKFHKKNTKAF